MHKLQCQRKRKNIDEWQMKGRQRKENCEREGERR